MKYMEIKSKFNIGDYAYYVGANNNRFGILYCQIDDINFGTLSTGSEDNHKITYNITIYYSDNANLNQTLVSNTKSTYRVYNIGEDVLFKDENDIIDYVKNQVDIIKTTIKNQSDQSYTSDKLS